MYQLAIWEVVSFSFAIGILNSVKRNFSVLGEVEANVSLLEFVEVHICAVPCLQIVALGLCCLKRKMAALRQATTLNQLFIFRVDVHLYAS